MVSTVMELQPQGLDVVGLVGWVCGLGSFHMWGAAPGDGGYQRPSNLRLPLLCPREALD